MFEKIKNTFRQKISSGATAPDSRAGASDGMAPSMPADILRSFGIRNGSYDNTYPSISRIAEAVAEIPFIAIDKNGKEVANANVVNVLERPNKQMSGTDFRETLMTMLLVHPKVYLLAWRKVGTHYEPGGNITEQNFGGLTFLEGVHERIYDGKSTYSVAGKTYTEQEVLSLSLSINPYNLAEGYSPSVASKKWATVDDFIVEFQAAQFRNGGTPAGMFSIEGTEDQFNATVDLLVAKTQGVRNSNNVVYIHRPPMRGGEKSPAQVEWTPIAQTNKDMTLEAVYKQSNQKIESVFGVPDEVRGHLQNSNYASAEVADYIFSRRVIYPKLVKICSKLTHELNRITGGMGYALSFNYRPPMLTDTRKLQAEALKTMMDAGFTAETAVEALQLPESYKVLKKEKMEVKDKGGVAGALAAAEPIATTRLCPKGGTPDGIRARRSASGQVKTKEDLTDAGLIEAYDHLINATVERVTEELPDLLEDVESLEDKIDALEERLLADYQNEPSFQEARTEVAQNLTRIATEQMTTVNQDISIQLDESINYQAERVVSALMADGFIERDLYDSFRALALTVLNKTALIIYNAEEDASLADELTKIKEQDYYRAVRFSFTEQQLVRSFVSQQMWEWAADDYQFSAKKEWCVSPLSPAPCEECLRINGEIVPLTATFSNGKKFPPAHPNCYCYLKYYAERKSITPYKIACPKCGRFLMDTNCAEIDKMICPNTKCKARLTVLANGDGWSVKEIAEEEQDA